MRRFIGGARAFWRLDGGYLRAAAAREPDDNPSKPAQIIRARLANVAASHRAGTEQAEIG